MNVKTVHFKIVSDDSADSFEAEFEISPDADKRQQSFTEEIDQVEKRMRINREEIEGLNKEETPLINHADKLDYIAAVGSGILAGLVDSFWVGKFDFKRGKAWSNKTANEFVMKIAKKQGYNGKRLDGAISHLENLYKIPSDNIWKGADEGISARSHHLDDLAHHPSPIGLLFSIIIQFTKKGYFQNSGGSFISISFDEDGLIGHDVKNKIFAGTINWFYHLVSDMSGSKKTAGVGMGIPGPIVSLLRELSLIPGLNKSGLAKETHNAFVKNKFDLRSEMAVIHELGRQAVPVILNEVIVRAFYFIRRLVNEIKEKGKFKKIEWKDCLPWNSRTIVRMLTVATGTFTACDLADAAIRGAIKSGGSKAKFAIEFLLRVNIIGVGRFAIAGFSDAKMGIKRAKITNRRIAVYNEQLHLANAKIFYLQAGMWKAAETTEQSVNEVFDLMEKTRLFYNQSVQDIGSDIVDIGRNMEIIKKKNKKLFAAIMEKIQ
jgi:hypothetical protein